MSLKSQKIYGRFIGESLFAANLFGDLPRTTREKIAAIKRRKAVKKGETISKIGSFPENIYVLTEGTAQMVVPNALNRQPCLRLIEKEEFINLTEAISGLPNEMSVISLSPCSLNAFRTQDFLRFLKDEPQVCFRLFKQLSLNIQSSCTIFSSMFF